MTNPQIDYAAMAAQWRAERETTLNAHNPSPFPMRYCYTK